MKVVNLFFKSKGAAGLKWSESDETRQEFVDRVSVQGVESLWDDCRFIPADLGSYVIDLCYFALFEDFSL